jgi:hypothetical protein
MRVRLDEFPDGKAIRRFFRGDGHMFAHAISPFQLFAVDSVTPE